MPGLRNEPRRLDAKDLFLYAALAARDQPGASARPQCLQPLFKL